MEKIKLNLIGLSYSQSQSGAYTMILEDETGNARFPIIIGSFEAQSIAIELEKMKPTRPLTHDLFKIFIEKFGVTIIEIVIYKLSEGVFFSKLVCDDGKEIKEIDSRTSDAIAIALRVQCPIYTFQSIIDEVGQSKEGTENKSPEEISIKETKEPTGKLTSFSNYSMEELEEMLATAIEEEAYEKASLIRDEIDNRKKKK